ncbi:major tail protein [Paraclostridium tenue]|uniref:Phage tail protein n=1 Tax=Paraclostridium tenue TaxID=1737 RepID=A0ABP3XGU4_9FIRM
MATYNEKIVFGFDKIHVAKVNEDGTFGVPVAILGAKSVEATFETSEKKVHADNKIVCSDKRVSSGKGKLGVLGLTMTEKALLAGGENMSGGFALSSTTNAPNLALLFSQDKKDGGQILSVLYNVQFDIPGINATTTEDEIEEQIFEIDFTSLPSSDGYYYYTVDTKDKDADQAIVSKWFTEVQKPKRTVSGANVKTEKEIK